MPTGKPDDILQEGGSLKGHLVTFIDPGAQREVFIAAMTDKQIERSKEVGTDTWREYEETYGVRLLYAEIASINSRLKQMFWDVEYDPRRVDRASDLLIDLGNYASFLYATIQDE
jgi:hypothetical protein